MNVRYRDIRYAVPFLTQFWMFATPIAYPSSLSCELAIRWWAWSKDSVGHWWDNTQTLPASHHCKPRKVTFVPEDASIDAHLADSIELVGRNVADRQGCRSTRAGTDHRRFDNGLVGHSGFRCILLPSHGKNVRRCRLASREIEFSSGRCLVIAEVAQAHDGSLGTAHAYIDAVAKSGADAIKFQTHIAEAESTPGEPWRIKFSPQDETRFDYWKRMEFTEPQWHGLKQHADEAGLLFLSSPFSDEAIELLCESWRGGLENCVRAK